MQTYDITDFMTWWVNQCINIFTYTFNLLDNIQFEGTSLLRITIWIAILGALFKVALTIPQGIGNNSSSERAPSDNPEQYRQAILNREKAKQRITSERSKK